MSPRSSRRRPGPKTIDLVVQLKEYLEESYGKLLYRKKGSPDVLNSIRNANCELLCKERDRIIQSLQLDDDEAMRFRGLLLRGLIQHYKHLQRLGRDAFARKMGIRYQMLTDFYSHKGDADNKWLYAKISKLKSVLQLNDDQACDIARLLIDIYGDLARDHIPRSILEGYSSRLKSQRVVFHSREYSHELERTRAALRGLGSDLSRGENLLESFKITGNIIKEDIIPHEDDPNYLPAIVQSHMLYAAYQEILLPWGKGRPRSTIRTYDRLLDKYFIRYIKDLKPGTIPQQLAEEYARLVLRRATLFREDSENNDPEECANSLRDREMGDYVKQTGNPIIDVAYRTQIVHTYAVQNVPIHQWQHAVDDLRNEIDKMKGIDRDTLLRLQAIVTYTEGVGFKRYMWELRNAQTSADIDRRERYARHAFSSLGSLLSGEGENSARDINLYHPNISEMQSRLELEAAIIDALYFYDKERTLSRAESLLPLAERWFPSVKRKLMLNITDAKRDLDIEDR